MSTFITVLVLNSAFTDFIMVNHKKLSIGPLLENSIGPILKTYNWASAGIPVSGQCQVLVVDQYKSSISRHFV